MITNILIVSSYQLFITTLKEFLERNSEIEVRVNTTRKNSEIITEINNYNTDILLIDFDNYDEDGGVINSIKFLRKYKKNLKIIVFVFEDIDYQNLSDLVDAVILKEEIYIKLIVELKNILGIK